MTDLAAADLAATDTPTTDTPATETPAADAAVADGAGLDLGTPDVGPRCPEGQAVCAGQCIDVAADNANCGACGNVCALPNTAMHACTRGVCAPAHCASGYADCDGTAANGCEADVASGAANCGACGRVCALPNAIATCAAGACAVTTCAAGFADCNRAPADGCEVDARSDEAHCGACATACPTRVHAAAHCAGGACGIACAAGFGDCNGAADDGCETDLTVGPTNCGTCGRSCGAGLHCAAGACVCPAGQRLLGAICVASDTAPRPVSPASLGDVTQRRPTLRWALPAAFDGAVVELCRDRACAAPIETLTVSGTAARPTADLPARRVVFWRLRGRAGTTTDDVYGPTWLFHVPATSATGGVDTSSNPHFDANADGFDDVVVGSEASPGGLHHAGTVSVFFGGAAGLAATAARVIEGGAWNEGIGNSIANASDLNGDGYADLAIGSPSSSPGGRPYAGKVGVYFGSAAGIAAAPAIVLEGVEQGAAFGRGLAGVGDVNGDGYADLAVGAPNSTRDVFAAGAGVLRVYFGRAAGVSVVAAGELWGDVAIEAFGDEVAGAGDLNGDGFADFAVGASGAHPGGRDYAGTASVFLGSAAGVPAVAARTFEGDLRFANFGGRLASAGDVDGDGYGDLVVGRPGASSVFHGAASGIAATAATIVAGVAVAGAGDVNGDGYADLLVGNPGDYSSRGTARVFHGGPAGIGPTAIGAFTGAAMGDQFGWSVAGAGDVDGDGYDDLLVGAVNASPGGLRLAGAVSLFRGSALGASPTAAIILPGAASEDIFGVSIADARRVPAPHGCALPSRRIRRRQPRAILPV